MMTLSNLLNAHNEISFSPSAIDRDIEFAKNRPGFGVEGEEFADIALIVYLNHLLQNPFSCEFATCIRAFAWLRSAI